MGKEKRQKKLTVYGCVEGNREELFLKFLIEIYQPRKNNINPTLHNASGGTPDANVGLALKNCDRDRSFAWFDEDFEPSYPLGEEIRQDLINNWCINKDEIDSFYSCRLKDLQSYNRKDKNPYLIISQPVCVESIILKALGHTIPVKEYDATRRKQQIDALKNTLMNLIGKDADEIQFYRNNLTKEMFEEKRKSIFELNLLISMITQDNKTKRQT